MSKKSKLIILDMFILGVIVFGGYLIKNNYINYALIVFAIAVSFIIQELTYRFTGDTKEEKYETKLKKILKTYDSVLVETRKVPVIDSEKVILVNSLDDLIDAQLELRKMIYYFKQSDNCSFVLFDQNQANIFILKSNEEVISPLEIEINNNKITIIDEDVKHIKNVLRKQIGDKIEVCNQDTGNSYKCEIEIIAENEIETKIIEEQKNIQEKIKVDIYQGLPKSDKMELIIQKSVELGANSIIPVNMKRCVVKLEGKDEIKKNERWQKIAESAAKQCGRGFIPEVKHLINVKEICNWINEYDVIIVAYENEKENTLKTELKKLKATDLKIGIVIGPEGGFEESDIKLLKESGAKIVTLGDRILRTETVALNVLSIIMYEFEQ